MAWNNISLVSMNGTVYTVQMEKATLVYDAKLLSPHWVRKNILQKSVRLGTDKLHSPLDHSAYIGRVQALEDIEKKHW